MPDALTLSNVTKKFGDVLAVDDVSFSVAPGSVCGFLGQNGAGKTTTIRMILDITQPTSGSLQILGSNSIANIRNRIGYLPEEKGLYKNMRPAAFIAYFAALKGVSRSQAKKTAIAALKKYGLGEALGKKLSELSKGMGQKVQVLASIAHAPDFVILDEPFSGLDPVNQQVMEDIIQDMAKSGRTVLFSTHVMQHAERLCERVILLGRGRKIFDGTVPEARSAIPRRAIIETAHPIDELRRRSPSLRIRELQPDPKTPPPLEGASADVKKWEVDLSANEDVEGLLKAIFDSEIRLKNFQTIDPSLHDIFVELVHRSESNAQ